MSKIYRVKELKEFLNKIPDDAFVFNQLDFEGIPHPTIISSSWKKTEDNQLMSSMWAFPGFPTLGLTNEDPITKLTEIYNRNH